MATSSEYLATAIRLGDGVVDSALWHGSECTWNVQQPLFRPGKRARPGVGPADGGVYRGTAGIAWFLLELYRYTGDGRYAETSSGALRHAIRRALTARLGRGLYDGRDGIALVAALSLGALGSDEHAIVVPSLLAAAAPDARLGDEDIIAGMAGAIIALLTIGELLNDQSHIEDAYRLGRDLYYTATREARGWSWGRPAVFKFRNLTGLAHGAAGFAWAFGELYNATGDAAFLHATDEAIAYERSCFDKKERNWPDYRLSELSTLASSPSLLGTTVERQPELVQYTPRCMNAWCHGAPGIALTRFRLFHLLQVQDLLNDALIGTHTTVAAMGSPRPSDYSLCHGVAGRCETILEALKTCPPGLESQPLREALHAWADFGVERYALCRKPWPCGTIGGVSDPCLMIGESGIGLFYLRLSGSDALSAALPAPALRARGSIVNDRYRSSHDAYVRAYFGRTLDMLDGTLGLDLMRQAADGRPADLGRVLTLLKGRVEAAECPPCVRATLDLEIAAYELGYAPPGWPLRLLESAIGVPDPVPDDWVVQIAPSGVRLMEIEGSKHVNSTMFWLLTFADGGVRSEQVDRSIASLLDAASLPITVSELAKHIQRHNPETGVSGQWGRAAIRHHLKAGVLVRADRVSPRTKQT